MINSETIDVDDSGKNLKIERSMHKYFKAFKSHKRVAKAREILFMLTWEEWIYIWKMSGVLEERGSSQFSYVMSRHLNKGAYEMGNVFIQTNGGNAYDAYRQNKRTFPIPRDIVRKIASMMFDGIEEEEILKIYSEEFTRQKIMREMRKIEKIKKRNSMNCRVIFFNKVNFKNYMDFPPCSK